MATTVREIISRAYSLLNNVSEEELSPIVALEQYAITVSEMQHEKILGNINPEIRKAEIVFSDDSGIANDTLPAFTEDVVFARFSEMPLQVVPVNTLDIYKDSGQQAVAFYKDSTSGTPVSKVELAVKMTGTLTVWYEPRTVFGEKETDNIMLEDEFKHLLSTRLAFNCGKYVIFNDERKEANKMMLLQGLKEQADYAKDLYKTRMNRIDVGNRPFSRLPYMSR